MHFLFDKLGCPHLLSKYYYLAENISNLRTVCSRTNLLWMFTAF